MSQDIYLTLGSWTIVTIAAERVIEIISDSKIFFPMRNWLATKAMLDISHTKFKTIFVFLNSIVSCSWCLSVWASMFFCLFLPGEYLHVSACDNIVIKCFALVGITNLWHSIFRFISRGRVVTVDIKHTVEMINDDGEREHELSKLGIIVGGDDGECSKGNSAAE